MGDTDFIKKTEFNGPMKALQILQTIMLAAMLAVGAWIGTTTVESARAIARMEEQVKGISTEQSRVNSELIRLWQVESDLEHRTTVIEGRLK